MCAALALVQYGLADDDPRETETCSKEIKVNHKNIDLESLLW
jgi:hypothetical protein